MNFLISSKFNIIKKEKIVCFPYMAMLCALSQSEQKRVFLPYDS